MHAHGQLTTNEVSMHEKRVADVQWNMPVRQQEKRSQTFLLRSRQVKQQEVRALCGWVGVARVPAMVRPQATINLIGLDLRILKRSPPS